MNLRHCCAMAVGLWVGMMTGCVPVGNGPPDGGSDGTGSNDGNGNNDGNGGTNGVTPAPALFAVASGCAICHNNLTDATGSDVSIQADWRATMMANAARDPYFLAKVSTEIEHNPDLRAVIEGTCSRCHMPMARTQAAVDGTAVAMLDAGFLDPANALHELAMDSVSCTVCHQIENVALGEPDSFSGNYTIDQATASPDRVNYGPFDDPEVMTMRAAAGFTPVQSDHLSTSALCATCHTLFTPYVDAAGTVQDDTFPEQVAFLEWRHSAFGDGVGEDQSCQDCHLPDAAGAVVISPVPARLAPRSPFGRHHFVGGNTLMLNMLADHATDLAVTASAADFDAVISRTLEQLQQRTAEVRIVDVRHNDSTLAVEVSVANNAGHKLPTGFPARRAWLHLVVTAADGAVVFESGAAEPNGRITGHDADDNRFTVEPHHTIISDANQVQVYEAVMQDTDGQVTYTLLRAAAYRKDNRLLPRGFDKSTAGEDFAVYGLAATDPDFVGGSDHVQYELDVSGHQGPFTITVALLYQSIAYPFVEDIRPSETPLADRFVTYYDAADKTPVILDSTEQQVP